MIMSQFRLQMCQFQDLAIAFVLLVIDYRT